MKTAVYRVDASPKIGGGHVMRCLSLADRLAADGWTSTFVVSPETPGSVPALAEGQHCVRIADRVDDAECVRACGPVDLIVVDHYGLDAEFEARCRDRRNRLLVLDDLADRAHDPDILLDMTPGRRANEYHLHVQRECHFLLGPAFALLRSAFMEMRDRALERRRNARGERVMICMGNSDPHDVTSLALDAINKCGRPLQVDVVLGAKSPNLRSLVERMDRLGGRLYVDARNIATLMCEADVAIGSCGTISWERCALGLPAIGVLTAENQRQAARHLADAGAIIFAGTWTEVTTDSLAVQLDRIFESPGLLTDMAAAASRFCDGAGTHRVAQFLNEVVSPHGISQ